MQARHFPFVYLGEVTFAGKLRVTAAGGEISSRCALRV